MGACITEAWAVRVVVVSELSACLACRHSFSEGAPLSAGLGRKACAVGRPKKPNTATLCHFNTFPLKHIITSTPLHSNTSPHIRFTPQWKKVSYPKRPARFATDPLSGAKSGKTAGKRWSTVAKGAGGIKTLPVMPACGRQAELVSASRPKRSWN